MLNITYCGANYKPCLDITLPTWGDNVMVYSDTEDFGIKMFEPSEDLKESWHRKILVIQRTLKEHPGENILYLDSDVLLVNPPLEVFDNGADLTVTRMVMRDRPYKEINAGVSFWKSNDRTIKACEDWLRLEAEYSKDPTIPYAEQRALNQIAFEGYDGLRDLKVANVSENVYNLERDDTKEWMKAVELYKPKIIHLKGKRWQNKLCTDWLENYLQNKQ